MPVFTAAATALLSSTALAGSAIATSLLAGGLAYGTGHLLGVFDVPDLGPQEDPGVEIRLGPNTRNRLPLLYGNWMNRGIVTFIGLSNNSQKLHAAIALGEGPVASFGTIYIEDYELGFDTNGNVTSATKYSSTDTSDSSRTVVETTDRFNGRVRINTFLGGASNRNTRWESAGAAPVTGWLTTHTMTNVAWAAVEVDYSREHNLTGVPDIRFTGAGMYSNPALAVKDLLQNDRYGLGFADDMIDSTSFTAAEQFYNESVANIPLGAGSEVVSLTDRYRVDGVVDSSATVMQRVSSILLGASSVLQWSNGRWGIFVNKADSNVGFTMNQDRVIGSVSVVEPGFNELYNEVEVIYGRHEVNNWQGATIQYSLPAASRYDNELTRKLELRLDNVSERAQAALIGVIQLNQSRQQLTVSHRADIHAISLEAGDVVPYTLPDFGWTNKQFRILSKIERQTEDGAIEFEIEAVEYAAAVYTPARVAAEDISPNTTPLTIGDIPAATNLTVSDSDSLSTPPYIELTWTVPNGLIQFYDVYVSEDNNFATARVEKVIDSPAGTSFAAGSTSTQISTLTAGTWYFWVVGRNDASVSVASNVATISGWDPQTNQALLTTVRRFSETAPDVEPGQPPANATAEGTPAQRGSVAVGATAENWYDANGSSVPTDPLPRWEAVAQVASTEGDRRVVNFNVTGTGGTEVLNTNQVAQVVDFAFSGTVGHRTTAFAARPEITTFTSTGNSANVPETDPGAIEAWQIACTGETHTNPSGVTNDVISFPAPSSFRTARTRTFTFGGTTANGTASTATITAAADRFGRDRVGTDATPTTVTSSNLYTMSFGHLFTNTNASETSFAYKIIRAAGFTGGIGIGEYFRFTNDVTLTFTYPAGGTITVVIDSGSDGAVIGPDGVIRRSNLEVSPFTVTRTGTVSNTGTCTVSLTESAASATHCDITFDNASHSEEGSSVDPIEFDLSNNLSGTEVAAEVKEMIESEWADEVTLVTQSNNVLTVHFVGGSFIPHIAILNGSNGTTTVAQQNILSGAPTLSSFQVNTSYGSSDITQRNVTSSNWTLQAFTNGSWSDDSLSAWTDLNNARMLVPQSVYDDVIDVITRPIGEVTPFLLIAISTSVRTLAGIHVAKTQANRLNGGGRYIYFRHIQFNSTGTPSNSSTLNFATITDLHTPGSGDWITVNSVNPLSYSYQLRPIFIPNYVDLAHTLTAIRHQTEVTNFFTVSSSSDGQDILFTSRDGSTKTLESGSDAVAITPTTITLSWDSSLSLEDTVLTFGSNASAAAIAGELATTINALSGIEAVRGSSVTTTSTVLNPSGNTDYNTGTVFTASATSANVVFKSGSLGSLSQPTITVDQGSGSPTFTLTTLLEGRSDGRGGGVSTGATLTYGTDVRNLLFGANLSATQVTTALAAYINGLTTHTATGSGSVVTATSAANVNTNLTLVLRAGSNAAGESGDNDLSIVTAVTQNGNATAVLGGRDATITVMIGDSTYRTAQAFAGSSLAAIVDALDTFLDTADSDITQRYAGTQPSATTLRCTASNFTGSSPTITLVIDPGLIATSDDAGNVTETAATLAAARTVINDGQANVIASGQRSTYTVTQGTTNILNAVSIPNGSTAAEAAALIAAAIGGEAASEYAASATGSTITATSTFRGTSPDITLAITAGLNSDNTAASLATTKTIVTAGSADTTNLSSADWDVFPINTIVGDGDLTDVTNNVLTNRRGVILDTDVLGGNVGTTPSTTRIVTDANHNSTLVMYVQAGLQYTYTALASGSNQIAVFPRIQIAEVTNNVIGTYDTLSLSADDHVIAQSVTNVPVAVASLAAPAAGSFQRDTVGHTVVVNVDAGTTYAMRVVWVATQGGSVITLPSYVNSAGTWNALIIEEQRA